MGVLMAKLATAYLELIPSMAGSETAITQALIPSASAAGDAAGERAGRNFGSRFGGVLAAGAIVAGVVGAFGGLYQVGSIFDDVSDTIRTGTGATGEALAGLEADARAVATSVPASFEAAGSTVADLNTRLGLSGQTLQTVASQYLEAGRILGEEVDVQSTTAAFSAFRIEGDAVSGAMDTLFQVSQATGVGMNALSSTVQAQAPAMQALGFSFEETAALAGSLDRAGLNTTQVMASMGRGLVTLARDGEEPQEAFRRVTGEIEALIASGDQAAAIDLASGIFGTRGATQFVGAVQSGNVALGDLMGGLSTTGDTILGVGRETMDFAEAWTLVKNQALAALEPIGTAVFSRVGQAMLFVADNMGRIPELFAPLMPLLTTVGGAFAGAFSQLGAAFGPLVPQLVALVTQFSPLGILFRALAPVLPQIAGLLGQLGATIAGALGQALQIVVPILTQLAGIFVGVLSQAITTILPIIVQLVGVLGPVLGSVLGAVMPLLSMLGTLISTLVPIVMPLISAVLQLVSPILMLISPIMQLVGALLPPLIQLFMAIAEPVLGLAVTLIGMLVPAITFVVQAISTLIGWIVQGIQWFVNLVTGAGNSGAQVQAIFTRVGAVVGQVWTAIRSFFSQGVANIRAVFGAIGGFFTQVWNNVGNAFRSGVSTAVSIVVGLGTRIWSTITGIGDRVFQAGRRIIERVAEGIRGAIGFVTDAVGSVMGVIQSFFPSSPARRGPFSGSGWTRVAQSGGALAEQFVAGFDAVPSPDMRVSVPEVPFGQARVAGSGVGSAGSDRPIFMRDGTLFGWIREIAGREAELILNASAARVGAGVKGKYA